MGLETRHNRAQHFHENTQFRRIAIGLKKLFAQKGWDGLLIGNPESEDYSRFRADAILLYNHGFLILDFKDYQGTIKLPPNDIEFKSVKWYIETEKDKFRLEVKGASFNNPFIQLNSYRQAMKEIVNNSPILSSNIDRARLCAINLFSGPIQLNRETPRSLPFYVITQESDFFNFLYDYNSPNTFSEESAKELKKIFPAPVWEEQTEIPIETVIEHKVYEIDSDLENEIQSFLQNEESEILVLESMDVAKRDGWVNYILRTVGNHNIPQTETWTHSTRIREKIKKRSGFTPQSVYNTIYGGPAKIDENKEPENEENLELETEEEYQSIIPIKSDNELDERAVIILHEAHLVTRSLNQTELLRFGTGRLLEDLLCHLSLGKTKRKLICIGDPFFLSYGKEDESAIAVDTLNQLFDGKIRHYREVPKDIRDLGKEMLRADLACSINDKNYNELQYHWKADNLLIVEKLEVLNLLKNWFSNIFSSEPSNAVLLYKNDDARTTNLWIKENCLNNSKELSQGDLLIVNNNVTIADETGFGGVTRLYNGMYLTLQERLDTYSETIFYGKNNQSIVLEFIKLKVKCISIEQTPETEVWSYNNYFNGNGKLSKEEQIAFKVFTAGKIAKYKKENGFESSEENILFKQDNKYAQLRKEIEELKVQFNNGERVKTKLEEKERELRKVENKYKRKHQQRVVFEVTKSDPFLNSILVNYGWCITVHKSVGSQFDNVIINAKQGDTNGITNESYYRWLYSGVSSAQTTVFVANPEEINPLKDCQFEDLADDNWTDKAKTSNKFEVENYDIPQIFESKIDVNLSMNAKASICIFSEFIEKHGIILEQTNRSGDYLSKATFSTPSGFNLVMAFSNNGQGIITSIRPEKSNNAILESIEKGVLHVWSNSNEKSESSSFPVDFRNKIYEKWIKDADKIGSQLTLIESHPYQDIFIYSSITSKIKFRVNYDGNGFFTKIVALKKSDAEISNNLKNLLFYGD